MTVTFWAVKNGELRTMVRQSAVQSSEILDLIRSVIRLTATIRLSDLAFGHFTIINHRNTVYKRNIRRPCISNIFQKLKQLVALYPRAQVFECSE